MAVNETSCQQNVTSRHVAFFARVLQLFTPLEYFERAIVTPAGNQTNRRHFPTVPSINSNNSTCGRFRLQQQMARRLTSYVELYCSCTAPSICTCSGSTGLSRPEVKRTSGPSSLLVLSSSFDAATADDDDFKVPWISFITDRILPARGRSEDAMRTLRLGLHSNAPQALSFSCRSLGRQCRMLLAGVLIYGVAVCSFHRKYMPIERSR